MRDIFTASAAEAGVDADPGCGSQFEADSGEQDQDKKELNRNTTAPLWCEAMVISTKDNKG